MLSPPLNLTLAPTFLTKDHQLCKVYPSSDNTHISDSLVPAAEEQDSSPLAASGNQEETAGTHTNAPPSVEGDIGDDFSLLLDTNSPKEQPAHPVIEEQDSSPLAPSGNQEEIEDSHTNTPPSVEDDIGDEFSLPVDTNSPKEQPTHPGIEKQDNSPLAPSGNQEETADNHTNTPPSVEGDIGDDYSLHLDTNSPKEQPVYPIIEEQDSSPLAPSGNQEETADNHANTPPSVESDIGDGYSLHLDTNSPKEQLAHPVIEEQGSSPLAPSGNQEETADNHTNSPPSVEDDIDDECSSHLDTNSPKEQPTHPITEERATVTSPLDVDMHPEPKENVTDLLFRIRGLYRLLDLISEQGSGGAGMINVLSGYTI